jgi:hypothetical protein
MSNGRIGGICAGGGNWYKEIIFPFFQRVQVIEH